MHLPGWEKALFPESDILNPFFFYLFFFLNGEVIVPPCHVWGIPQIDRDVISAFVGRKATRTLTPLFLGLSGENNTVLLSSFAQA